MGLGEGGFGRKLMEGGGLGFLIFAVNEVLQLNRNAAFRTSDKRKPKVALGWRLTNDARVRFLGFYLRASRFSTEPGDTAVKSVCLNRRCSYRVGRRTLIEAVLLATALARNSEHVQVNWKQGPMSMPCRCEQPAKVQP